MSRSGVVRRLGVGAFALALFAAAGIMASRPIAYDFSAYWLAGRHLLDGAALYPTSSSGAIFLGQGEFLYEPLVALAFVPLALLPFELAAWLWTAALVLLAAALGGTLVRRFRPEHRPWVAAAYAIYLPLLAEITLGNLNLVSVVLTLGAWRLRDRPRIGGAILAAAIALKLLPVTLLVFYATARRWRLAGWAVATGAIAVAVSMPFLAERWVEYLRFFGAALAETGEFAINIVPAPIASTPLRFALPVVAIAVAAYAGTRDRRRTDPAEHNLALLAAPLVSPLVWYPYLVFAAPALAVTGALAAGPWRLAVIASYIALEMPRGRGPFPDAAFVGLLALILITGRVISARTRDAPAT